MIQKKKLLANQLVSALAALLTGLAVMPVVAAENYAEARAELVAAWQAEDFPAMREAARQALAFRPNHTGARFNLALAHAVNGDDDSALMELHRVADDGVYFPVETMEAFTGLQDEFTWPDLLFKHERLLRPRGELSVAASFGAADFIPEGILRLGEEHFILGSIFRGSLLEYRDGELREISSPASGGHWSVFGIRQDAEENLWFASSAVEQFAGVTDDDLGRAGLFQVDLATGEIVDEMLLPDDGAKHVLGDLVIDSAGIIYTTDSLTGSVYRYDPRLRQLDELVKPGRMVSPQGLVLLPDEQALLVADYATGLVRIGLADGDLAEVTNLGGASLQGIDGLYRDGDALVAIQNGIRPHRVVRLQYDPAANRVTRNEIIAANHPSFREPTLGQATDGRFWFVANSQWDRFDRNGELDTTDLAKPIILETSIR